MNGSTTPARNSSRRSIVKCGSPIACASARACATAVAEQQLRSASFSRSAHSSSVTAAVGPSPRPGGRRRRCRRRRSSPPASVPGRRAAPARRREPSTARPSARASASAANSAACSLPGLEPPSSSAISAVPIRAASRIGAPRTSVTAALPAAWAEPQPSASKPASVTVSPSIWTLNVISSQQAPPPLVTVKASAGVCLALRRGQVVLEGEGVHRRFSLGGSCG